jgi:hypothetical protein
VNKFYDIGKELFVIDGEARLLIILIGKKYILTIVPKTHDVRSKTRTFFAVIIYYKASLHEVFSSLQQSAIRTADHERFCFASG